MGFESLSPQWSEAKVPHLGYTCYQHKVLKTQDSCRIFPFAFQIKELHVMTTGTLRPLRLFPSCILCILKQTSSSHRTRGISSCEGHQTFTCLTTSGAKASSILAGKWQRNDRRETFPSQFPASCFSVV